MLSSGVFRPIFHLDQEIQELGPSPALENNSGN
jgi:hypothetical protein